MMYMDSHWLLMGQLPEDTQIEATKGANVSTSRDDSDSGVYYTGGDNYTDYSYLYLDILAEETR